MRRISSLLAAAVLCLCLFATACQSGGIPESAADGADSSMSAENSSDAQTNTDNPAGSTFSVSDSTTSASGNTESPTTPSPTEPGPSTGENRPPTQPSAETPSTEPKPTLTYTQPDANGNQAGFLLSTFMAFDGDTAAAKNQRIVRNTRDAGLNLIEVTWLSTESSVLAALEAADAVGGVGLLIQNARGLNDSGTNLGGIGTSHLPKTITEAEVAAWVNKTRNYKSLYGYYVWDEPGTAGFADCRKLTDLYRRLAPDKMAYSCIVPSYGAYRWPTGYPAYVDEYLRTVKPPVLSMDYYPFQFQNSIKTTSDLWRDLGYLRKRAKETGIPHWHYFQAIDGSNALTVEQIRVQMSAALAYGVKGLSYYNSWNSLTKADGSPTANYEALKAINWQARRIGDLLYDKQNIAIHHTGLSAGYDSTYYLDPLSASPYIADAPDNLIIGVFSGGDSTYLVIANKDHTAGVSGSISLKTAMPLAQFQPDSGNTRSLGTGSRLSLSLEAGGIAVYILG